MSPRANQSEEKMFRRDVYQDRDLVLADEVGGMLDLDAVSKAFSFGQLRRYWGMQTHP